MNADNQRPIAPDPNQISKPSEELSAEDSTPYDRPRTPQEMQEAAKAAEAEAESQVSGDDMEDPPFLTADRSHKLFPAIKKELMDVFDPEIPVDIYQLGLIYGVDLEGPDGGKVKITMTLTAPACPVAEEMPGWVEDAMAKVDGITECEVDLVWDPPWDPDKMTELAKMELGIF
ncbi:MAG: hypothetical protein Alpg2KO_17320 [Alphaproteobacteria bacterium]